jgi:LysM repeat protein
MAPRFQARWIAPLALLAALLAVAVVFTSSTGNQADEPPTAGTSGEERTQTQERARTSTQPRTRTSTTQASAQSYTIRPGDTLGSIAAENDVTVEQLQELNPDVDSAALTVGERIRLPR